MMKSGTLIINPKPLFDFYHGKDGIKSGSSYTRSKCLQTRRLQIKISCSGPTFLDASFFLLRQRHLPNPNLNPNLNLNIKANSDPNLNPNLNPIP